MVHKASVVFSLVFGTRPVAMTATRHCHESRETNSPRAGAVEGHRRAWWRAARGRRREVVGGGGPHEARRGLRCHGGGLMRRGRRIGGDARKKRERARRCSTRKKRWGSICARHWRLYTREIYSQCQPPAGSKDPLLPVRVTNREYTFTPGW